MSFNFSFLAANPQSVNQPPSVSSAPVAAAAVAPVAAFSWMASPAVGGATAAIPPSPAPAAAAVPNAFGSVSPFAFAPAVTLPTYGAPASSSASSASSAAASTFLSPLNFGGFVPGPDSTVALLTTARNTSAAAIKRRLSHSLDNRATVFVLNWYESLEPNGPNLLLYYLSLSSHAWHDMWGRGGHDKVAHDWIVEKLQAELAEGHGFNHEARDHTGRSALELLLVHSWFTWTLQPVAMLRVLLASPSAAASLRDPDVMSKHFSALCKLSEPGAPHTAPLCDAAIESIAMLLERGAPIVAALRPAIAQSNVQVLVRSLQHWSGEPIQAEVDDILKLAQQQEQGNPYRTRLRLCRELMERLATEGTRADSASSAAASAAVSSASDLASFSPSFAAWLSAFESALPRRLLAQHCLSNLAALQTAVPQFDWLDLAEEGFIVTHFGSFVWERVSQLTARERARAADDPLIPAAGPLSTPAVLATLICQVLGLGNYLHPTLLLRELLSAATAPVFVAKLPSSELRIPGAIDTALHLSGRMSAAAASLLHEFGVIEDEHGRSFTERAICEGNADLLQQWLTPSNSHLSMPLGWTVASFKTMRDPAHRFSPLAFSLDVVPEIVELCTLDQLWSVYGVESKTASVDPAHVGRVSGLIKAVWPTLHPSAAAEAIVRDWQTGRFTVRVPDAPRGLSSIDWQDPYHIAKISMRAARDDTNWPQTSQDAESSATQKLSLVRFHVQHAIDWHYATVTPRLREALSPHLIPDLHAEVMSWLMPPSTLPDPAPDEDALSTPTALLDSVIDSLLPSQSASAVALRRVQQHLRDSAVAVAFTARALEAERRLAELRVQQ